MAIDAIPRNIVDYTSYFLTVGGIAAIDAKICDLLSQYFTNAPDVITPEDGWHINNLGIELSFAGLIVY